MSEYPPIKRCWPLFHSYLPWEDGEKGGIYIDGNDKRSGFWLLQSRRCKNCGKLQMRIRKTK